MKIIPRPVPSKRTALCQSRISRRLDVVFPRTAPHVEVAWVRSGPLISPRGHGVVPITDTQFAKRFNYKDLTDGTTAAITGVTYQ